MASEPPKKTPKMSSVESQLTPHVIAFDVSGVFKAGRYFFPDGLRALGTALSAGFQVQLVTNDGAGLTEAEYLDLFKVKVKEAASDEDRAVFSRCLDTLESDSCLVLSYTPMSEEPSFRHKRILLIGDPKEKTKAVARQYGWVNCVHVSDYCANHPQVDPFAEARADGSITSAVAKPCSPTPPPQPPRGDMAGRAVSHAHALAEAHRGIEDPCNDDFDAIICLTDPFDWYQALQASIDVVVSASPNVNDTMEFDVARRVQIHFSNPDIFWKASHPHPRFGQGAFRIAFEALLRTRLALLKAPSSLIDDTLRRTVVQWGKPSKSTLASVERRLESNGAVSINGNAHPTFWMIGDNPSSDMALIAMSSREWRGVLVRTGVFKDSDEKCGAVGVAGSVSSAVDFVLRAVDAETRNPHRNAHPIGSSVDVPQETALDGYGVWDG